MFRCKSDVWVNTKKNVCLILKKNKKTTISKETDIILKNALRVTKPNLKPTMQALQDLVCSECRSEFDSAAALLRHFAFHATNKEKPMTAKKLPDLYPISFRKKTDSDVGSDSGVEDVNPVKFCLVTMADEGEGVARVRRYECKYCLKRFGWPTDLKRHILTHTGERPFRCQVCDSTFNRNFLLKKHQRKFHGVPDLQEIAKSRKQEKSKIKRVMTQDMCESHD